MRSTMSKLRSLYAAAFTPPHRRVVLRAAHEACVAAAVAMDSHDKEAALVACAIDWKAQQEHVARVERELGGTIVVELPVAINEQKAPKPEEARLEE